MNPGFTIEGYKRVLLYKDPNDLEHRLDGMGEAGLSGRSHGAEAAAVWALRRLKAADSRSEWRWGVPHFASDSMEGRVRRPAGRAYSPIPLFGRGKQKQQERTPRSRPCLDRKKT
jgi:hypothetical protein